MNPRGRRGRESDLQMKFFKQSYLSLLCNTNSWLILQLIYVQNESQGKWLALTKGSRYSVFCMLQLFMYYPWEFLVQARYLALRSTSIST